MASPDWHPGIPAHLLTKEQDPWKTFYDNEAMRGNYQALAGEGMPSPGGAHLLGSGGTIGSAGDAERANDARQAAASLKMLQAQSSAGGGGTPASGSGGGGSGEVIYSPGGNYSRGPAMNDFDRARTREAEARAKAAEENVPSVRNEGEWNDKAFRRVTGQDEAQTEHEGKMAGLKSGSQKALEAQISAHTMLNDPDVWRAAELQRKWAIEGQQPKVDIAQTKASADVQRAEIAAWARTEAEKIKGDASQKIAVARLIEESLADAGNAYSTEDQLRLRAFADALKSQSSLLSPGAASLVKGPQ
jgi:hypothetical protein